VTQKTPVEIGRWYGKTTVGGEKPGEGSLGDKKGSQTPASEKWSQKRGKKQKSHHGGRGKRQKEEGLQRKIKKKCFLRGEKKIESTKHRRGKNDRWKTVSWVTGNAWRQTVKKHHGPMGRHGCRETGRPPE